MTRDLDHMRAQRQLVTNLGQQNRMNIITGKVISQCDGKKGKQYDTKQKSVSYVDAREKQTAFQGALFSLNILQNTLYRGDRMLG